MFIIIIGLWREIRIIVTEVIAVHLCLFVVHLNCPLSRLRNNSFRNDPDDGTEILACLARKMHEAEAMELDKYPLHSVLKSFAKKIEENVSVIEAIVSYFLANYPLSLQLRDDDELLPLHLALALRYPWAIAKLVMHSYPAACAEGNATGEYPLHLAMDYLSHDASAIRTLLQHYPRACELPDSLDGSLPLHRALRSTASEVSLEVVQILMDYYPEACAMEDQLGSLPLHHAAMNTSTSIQIFTLLIDKYPGATAARNRQDCLPLHLACIYEARRPIIAYLIGCYPQACETADEHGQYPLHLAAVKARSLDIMTMLIRSYPTACRIRDQYDKLPIHYVSYQINHEDGVPIIEKMLAYHPEIIHAPYNHMSTLYRYKYYYNRSIAVHRMMLNACPQLLEEADDRRSYRDFNWKARKACLMLMLQLQSNSRPSHPRPRSLSGQMSFLLRLSYRIDVDERLKIPDCFGLDILRWLLSYL
jgi:ankyrin repeat protein